MDNHILKFIWRYSRKQQMGIVFLTVLAFPLLYMTLEIPKWIINNALVDGASGKILFGFSLTPVEYLITLCVCLMILVILSGLLKMRINTYKGIIGERLIRRLRFSLMARLLRFPLGHYSSVSPGEMISTISSETEPLAGYIGESVALPLFQGGTMVTILIFMFAQNWVFGVVSVVLIPVQGYYIPKLQKKINLLKKDRIRRVRLLSERIGETVVGASEIRLHGTEKYTLAEFSRRFGDLFWVRLEIFKKKFYMKFLNNTIGQVTPFLYYLFGGYLVIQGSLTIGALVAAIAAYKDLTTPWRELLNHYQLHEDAKIKYQQIIAIFDVNGLVDGDYDNALEAPGFLTGTLSSKNINWMDVHGNAILSDVTFHAEPGSSVAIIGGTDLQRLKLTQLISGLDQPESGEIKFGQTTLDQVPPALFRTRLSLQGPDPHIFSGTIVENLEYGLNRKEPIIEIEDSLSRDVVEAEASGNAHPLTTDWVDYHIASQDDAIKNRQWYSKVIETIGAEKLIYDRSLDECFDPAERTELANTLLDTRKVLKKKLIDGDLQELVTRFDSDIYNTKSTVSENILFGTVKDDESGGIDLAHHPRIRRILVSCDVLQPGIEMGYRAAKRLLSLMHDLPRNDDLLMHFALTDLSFSEELKKAVDGYSGFDQTRQETHGIFLSVFMRLIPDKHFFSDFEPTLIDALLKVRHALRSNLPTHLATKIIHFDEGQYHPALSVRDNLLFGRVSTQYPDAQKRVDALIDNLVDQKGIKTDLMILSGDSQVGVGGSKLSVSARHTIALGRALMKRPDVLIFHDALSSIESIEKMAILERVRSLLPTLIIIWIDQRLDNAEGFERIYQFSADHSVRLTVAGDLHVTGSVRSQTSRPG